MASVMPSVSGEATLQARLNRNERFTQAELMALVAALADQLGEAHGKGRFHGAITPADIGYDDAGAVSLESWGRDTTPNAMQSSVYAPIECYAPVHPQGPWTDVYALAAILWRAITGEPPAAVLHRRGDVTLERLAPAGYEPGFLRGVDAALAVAPQRRPRDVDSWLAELADREPAVTTPVDNDQPETPARVPPPPRRAARWPVAALAAGVVAAVGGGIYLAAPIEQRLPPSKERQTAPLRPVVGSAPTAVGAMPPVDLEPVLDAPAGVAEPVPPADAAAAVPVPAAPLPAARAVTAVPAPAEPRPESDAPAPILVAEAPEPAIAPVAVAPIAAAPVAIDPPVALLRRADERLSSLYKDYDRLNARIARSYRSAKVPYATKEQTYRESRRFQAALAGLREDRNRIAEAESFAIANGRYDALAEDITHLRDRMEMFRRSL